MKRVPNEKDVGVVGFYTTDPAMKGEMTITISHLDAYGGTDLVTLYEVAVRPAAG